MTSIYSEDFNGHRDNAWALHVVRNPWGWSENDQRRARHMVADAYEAREVTIAKLQTAFERLEHSRKGKSHFIAMLHTAEKKYLVELTALIDAGHAVYPGKEFDTLVFDEWSKFLSKPITKAELGKVVNPKNKPFYRQFEEGRKWKF